MESGFKCGSGEPGSSFCVMMDILYHVPHLCGGFFAIFNELNSKTLKNGYETQNTLKTYKLSPSCSYLLTYVGLGEGNITASTLNVGLISTGSNASAKSLIQWIVKNGQNQSMFEFDKTDSSVLRVNIPASTWIIMSITKL